MKHIAKYASFITAATMMATAFVTPAFAQSTGQPAPGDLGLNTIAQNAGLGQNNLYQTVGSVIKIILSLLGVVAIVLVIYGGFKWMTSGGSEKDVDAAKGILLSGVIGFVIILSAYALSSFVIGSLLNVTGATGFTGV